MATRDIEDAVLRLILSLSDQKGSITDPKDQLNLARRVMESRIGEGQPPDSLKESWKRVQASGISREEQEKALQSLKRLQQLHPEDDFAENLLQVLVQAKNNRSQPLLQPSKRTLDIFSNQNVILQSLWDEEREILRECIFAMQGIDGERLKFLNKANVHPSQRHRIQEGIRVKSEALESRIPPSLVAQSRLGSGGKDALFTCGQAGWFYQHIETYCQLPSRGLIDMSFRDTLGREMESYRAFLSDLREQQNQLSLRQLIPRIRPPSNRLRILATVVDGVTHHYGSALLSAIYEHTSHGDTMHVDCVRSLLQQTLRPWFQMLQEWARDGGLDDEAGEFFIRQNDVDAPLLWREGYYLDGDKIPKGLGVSSLVEPLLSLGKGINYIRKCLIDVDWELSQEDTLDCVTSGELDLSSWKPKLEQANMKVHAHILQGLRERFHLVSHMFAMKQFLLLGQGDFFSSLMDGIHHEYQDYVGIVGIYKHSLAGMLDSAIKSSNASHFPKHVLERLQVGLRLSDGDPTQGMFGHSKESVKDNRTVWDIFTLEYRVPDPLIAIVDDRAQTDYQKAFSFLFGLRRIEFLLNHTWRESAVLQHALQASAQYNAIKVTTSPAYAQATMLLRQIAIIRQAMMHFVVNLKSFLMFEVLEGEWKTLVLAMEKATSLDELVLAHDRYLSDILRKSMQNEEKLRSHLSNLFSLCTSFCMYQGELFREAQASVDRSVVKRREAEQRLEKGDWGFHTEDEMVDETTFFGLSDASNLEEADRIASLFHEGILTLLKDLDLKLNGTSAMEGASTPTKVPLQPGDNEGEDLEPLRSLIFQLDHNNYYKLRKPLS